MNYLSKFVDSSEADISAYKTLPLIHTTDLFALRKIINEGNLITPKRDETFKENLLYLFYGKAAYTKKKELYSTFSSYYPITFIFNPEIRLEVKRVVLFDSGGLKAGVFKNYIPERLDIEDFQLELPDSFPNSVKKLQSAFYESNAKYYRNEPRKELIYDNLHFEVQSFLNLITSAEESIFDERYSTIEIQVTNSIELNDFNLLGVIMPSMIYESSDLFKNASATWKNVKIYTYNVFRAKPEYFASIIVEKLGNFLEEGKYI